MDQVEAAYALPAGSAYAHGSSEVEAEIETGEHDATEPEIHDHHPGIIEDEEDREIEQLIFETDDDDCGARGCLIRP